MHVHSNDERDQSLRRAMKMARLFQTKHFDKVMDPVYEYASKNKTEDAAYQDFKAACGKANGSAQLEDKEIEWLWNYLKSYKETLTKDAALYSAGIGW